MAKRVLVFGSGDVGTAAKSLLESQGLQVMGFADNNDKKWGTMKDGVPIFAPHDIPQLDIDCVAIGLFKAVERVRTQLNDLGVAEDKIFVPIEPARIYCNTRYEDDSGLNSPDKEADSESTRVFLQYRRDICDNSFLERLEELRQTLQRNNIPLAEVCIVSGAVLQAYGLRPSKLFDDVDIVMTSRFRELFGEGLVIVSDSAEMHPKDRYDISDDAIIGDSTNHFIWQGLKFIRLSLLYRHVKHRSTDEARLIEKFLNSIVGLVPDAL